MKDQLKELEKWATAPVEFSREGKRLDTSTVARLVSCITCYLGFCHRFQGVLLPTLECCYNVNLFLAYLAFLLWRHTAAPSFTKLFTAICLACRWFQTQTEDLLAKQVGAIFCNTRP